jgi:aminoglycoside/choline kinase family phosphotransferase
LEPRFDTRLSLLNEWLAAHFGHSAFSLDPASADASFRRYFRVSCAEATWIAMDAPPEREDCSRFVRVAEILRGAGVHVPAVVAQDARRGFLLLSDLGRVTYLDALNAESADGLFRDAVDALIRIQLASRPGILPPYDRSLLQREIDLFPEWYVGRHLGTALTAAESDVFTKIVERVLASNLAQTQVFVHRDYMPRNLMVSEPNPGILDFQDAVLGPIAYDVASLFRDAFVSWDEERVLDWTARYWDQGRRAGLPLATDFSLFYREFEWMGLQRHLKVLGIFARLRHRDGKQGYVEDTPRFVGYVRGVCRRYRDLAPLLALFDRLEHCAPATGG